MAEQDRTAQIVSALEVATQTIGSDPSTGMPERMGNLEGPLYEFSRRYCPTLCVDVVLVPEGDKPSVIFAKRGPNAVAPNQDWIFGGRVDKGLDYVMVGEKKTESEIGLKVALSSRDVIGFGTTIFPPNSQETKMRDYTVSTGNLCFATHVPLTTKAMSKIKPADGHDPVWRVATQIDADLDHYVLNAVANAWEKMYGSEWKNHVTDAAVAIIGNPRDFIPLRYHALK
jgi:hypothetical protein